MGSWKGRGNQYIQFVRVLYCKLPTIGKQLPAFPLESMAGIEPRPQRREARVLPLCHRGPSYGAYVGYRRTNSNMGPIKDIYEHKRPNGAHVGPMYIKISNVP